MSVQANCPACGAPVTFMWSSAVQTACPYCKAILVRHDVNIEKVGEVADLPRDASPIQVMTEGIFDNRRFMVIGRIVYEWEQGGWNEWHIAFDDGRSGWLSDARFGTIDYSEDPPLLYMGRQVDFDELKLRNLRMFEGW